MDRLSRRAVGLLYAAVFLESLCFYAPVASLYRLEYGVSVFQITLIESVFFVVSLLLEVPWGLVTARIGYKNTLVAAGAFHLAAALLFWRAEGFGLFLVQRCVLAVGISGFSGCEVAYLSRVVPPDRQHKALGRYNAAGFLAMVLVGLGFPLVRPLGYRAMALLSALCAGLGLALRACLPQVEMEPQDRQTLRQQLRALAGLLGEGRAFLVFVLCGGVLTEVEHTLTVFFASPAYQAAGIPQRWYGLLNLSLSVLGAAGGLVSARFARRGAGRAAAVFWLLALASAAGLWLTQNALALVVLLPLLRLAVQGYLPCEQLLKARRTGGASRAVALSAYNMLTSLVSVAVGPLLGAGAASDLRQGFGTAFFLLAAAGLATLLAWRQMARKA